MNLGVIPGIRTPMGNPKSGVSIMFLYRKIITINWGRYLLHDTSPASWAVGRRAQVRMIVLGNLSSDTLVGRCGCNSEGVMSGVYTYGYSMCICGTYVCRYVGR